MKRAFTLLEILVVIIIIGIIASMTFVSLNGTRAKSRDAKRISDIRQIQSALEMYRNDNNTYPQYVTPGMALIGSLNGQTYMKQIPNTPGKNDGSCSSDSYSYTPDNSNTSYHITYCLGGAVQSAGPSSCEALPGNICAPVASGGGGPVCGGYSFGGYCWYNDEDAEQSCDYVCALHGASCLAENWNDDTSCSVCKYFYPAAICSPIASINAPVYSGEEFTCFYRTGVSQNCASGSTRSSRQCACSF